MKVPLHQISHGRAGDKGNVSNISVIAYQVEHWPLILDHVTAERVLDVFSPLGATSVDRYELPHLHALNFVIHDALQGGVNASLSLDRHGKTLSFKLLGEVMVDLPDEKG
ncbi:MAG: hypothetical protein AAGH74_11390 [Pseudomonadota bacterium]